MEPSSQNGPPETHGRSHSNSNAVALLRVFLYCLVVAIFGAWAISYWTTPPDNQVVLNPDAEPRAVTPRGNLADDEQSTIDLFENSSDAVVFITTSQQFLSRGTAKVSEMATGQGSGFVWDKEGHIVTNFHVIKPIVQGSGRAHITFADGSTYVAAVVGTLTMVI